MPTVRKRIKQHRLAPSNVPVGLWRWLIDLPFDRDQGKGILSTFIYDHGELWNTHRAAVLSFWTREFPGTRPSLWWEFESPEPRRPGETEREYLRRHRLLTPNEIKKAR